MCVEKTKTVSNTMWILQYRNLVEGEIERDTESFLSTSRRARDDTAGR